jgi:hypothetical protein
MGQNQSAPGGGPPGGPGEQKKKDQVPSAVLISPVWRMHLAEVVILYIRKRRRSGSLLLRPHALARNKRSAMQLLASGLNYQQSRPMPDVDLGC